MRLAACTTTACAVEVRHAGEWGTVCADGNTQQMADMVCLELGFPSAKSLSRVQQPAAISRTWLDEVSCTGNEGSISMCENSGWGNVRCNERMALCCDGEKGQPLALEACPAGSFLPHPYNGDSCYSTAMEPRSYPEAEAYCKSWGGDVFSFSSNSEFNIAREVMGANTKFWVGLQRRRSSWLFLDGASPTFATSRWGPGKPTANGHDMCAAAYPKSYNQNNYLTDEGCNEVLPFMCKRYAPGKAPPAPEIPKATSVAAMLEDGDTVGQCPSSALTVGLYDGWTFETNYDYAMLGVGDYPYLSKEHCDNDKDLCIVEPCGIKPNTISSVKVPAGLAVTLYDRPNYQGESVTYYGPRDLARPLPADSGAFSDKAESVRVFHAPMSHWTMRVYKSTYSLDAMPSVGLLDPVGAFTTPWIWFTDQNEMKDKVADLPNTNFAMVFTGNLKIEKPGRYTFCTRSDDGSRG
jgi:hypothetical protein